MDSAEMGDREKALAADRYALQRSYEEALDLLRSAYESLDRLSDSDLIQEIEQHFEENEEEL